MTNKNPTNKMEYRMSDLAAVADSKEMIVTGYAIVFDTPTVVYTDPDGNQYKEVVRKGAIDVATKMDNVVMRYNHYDSEQILARTSNKTLQLEVDDKGLKITAAIAPTTFGKDIYALIQRRDVSGMSFAFVCDSDSYDYDGLTRYINHIGLIRDVSAVDIPAYDDSSLEVLKRGMDNAAKEAAEKAKAVKEAAEQAAKEKERRQKLYLATFF